MTALKRVSDSGSATLHDISIDVHAHIVPPFVGAEEGIAWFGQNDPLRRRSDGSLEKYTSSGWVPEAFRFDAEGIEQRLTYMDGIGLDMQILSLLPAMWNYGQSGHDTVVAAQITNDYLIDVAAAHSGRFRAFAHLPLDHPEEAITELSRVMQSNMIVGVGVGTHVIERHWDDPELEVVLEAAADLGAVVFFHQNSVRLSAHLPRHNLRNTIGNPVEGTIAVADLIFGGVLERLSNLRAVLSHGGGYATLALGRFDHSFAEQSMNRGNAGQRPSELIRRLYFDNVVHSDSALRFLIDSVGVSQVVLGSDYPAAMGPIDPIHILTDSPAFSDAEKGAILGSNLASLIGLFP